MKTRTDCAWLPTFMGKDDLQDAQYAGRLCSCCWTDHGPSFPSQYCDGGTLIGAGMTVAFAALFSILEPPNERTVL